MALALESALLGSPFLPGISTDFPDPSTRPRSDSSGRGSEGETGISSAETMVAPQVPLGTTLSPATRGLSTNQENPPLFISTPRTSRIKPMLIGAAVLLVLGGGALALVVRGAEDSSLSGPAVSDGEDEARTSPLGAGSGSRPSAENIPVPIEANEGTSPPPSSPGPKLDTAPAATSEVAPSAPPVPKPIHHPRPNPAPALSSPPRPTIIPSPRPVTRKSEQPATPRATSAPAQRPETQQDSLRMQLK